MDGCAGTWSFGWTPYPLTTLRLTVCALRARQAAASNPGQDIAKSVARADHRVGKAGLGVAVAGA
eukprot:4092796-Prymnesium_polylepis.1